MSNARIVRSLSLAAGLAVACRSTEPDQSSLWGSEQASLSISATGGTLQILASGGCYGSYGEISQQIPFGSFDLPGTYTQLTGVAPGQLTYQARYRGTMVRGLMTLSISLVGSEMSLGPYQLTLGEGRTWPPCRYP